MESFQQIVPQWATALRDNEKKELRVAELVVGDIVLLETGDRVPADIRILECQGKFVSAVVADLTFLFPKKKVLAFLSVNARGITLILCFINPIYRTVKWLRSKLF